MANIIPFNQTPAGLAMRPPTPALRQNFHQPTQDPAMLEVMEMLENEPINAPVIAPTVNISELCEKLAVLVSTGRCKEAIGTNLTQEHVKRLDDKDVIKYYKRYETYVGSKTTDSLIDNFLSLAIKGVGMVMKIDDNTASAMKDELKADFIINKEMSQFCGALGLRFGSALAAVNAAAIIAKHVDFGAEQNAEQCPANAEQMLNNAEQCAEQCPAN